LSPSNGPAKGNARHRHGEASRGLCRVGLEPGGTRCTYPPPRWSLRGYKTYSGKAASASASNAESAARHGSAAPVAGKRQLRPKNLAVAAGNRARSTPIEFPSAAPPRAEQHRIRLATWPGHPPPERLSQWRRVRLTEPTPVRPPLRAAARPRRRESAGPVRAKSGPRTGNVRRLRHLAPVEGYRPTPARPKILALACGRPAALPRRLRPLLWLTTRKAFRAPR